ncbi:MAG: hypothetical protein E4H36_00080 [Spirochaetales bacterium]|nr:MAG: hypothetical protein E4H36_00080 [Spirochaetales bacterium]
MNKFRLIVPAFPYFNVFSDVARQTTSLGPMYIATAASEVPEWQAEVIDENNCGDRSCPKDSKGRPAHKKLQFENQACAAGFYGSLTTTIPRLYEVARQYQESGVLTIAGGKHIECYPDEALHSGLDIAVSGEGETAIREVLSAYEKCGLDRRRMIEGGFLDNIPGLSYLNGDSLVQTRPRPVLQNLNGLPLPDFSLIRYARMRYYPVGRIRGCNMKCEFCSVKSSLRCIAPEKIAGHIIDLAETRGVKKFFEVSDNFAAVREDTLTFCNILGDYREKTQARFTITAQIRLNTADDTELLAAMRRAGVNNLAVGYESPIDEELKCMQKGYTSRDMAKWTDKYHRHGFFIHGMFIFGYPRKKAEGAAVSLQERVNTFREFIKKTKIDTIQVVLPVPLPGTALRDRLVLQDRVFPVDAVGYEYYDGQYPLFEPDDGISPDELRRAALAIMFSTYNLNSMFRMLLNVFVYFPRVILVSLLSIFTFRIKRIIQAFLDWKKRYIRNPFIRFAGYLILKNWLKDFKKDKISAYLSAWRKIRKYDFN